MLFQIGKQQTGFLVDTNIDDARCSRCTCATASSAFGTNAFDGSHLFVPCSNHIQQVNVDVAHRTMSLGWIGPRIGAAGSPILAGGKPVDDRPGLGDAVRARTRRPARCARPSRVGSGRALRRAGGRARARARPDVVGDHRVRRARRVCRRTRRARVITPEDHTGYWVAGSDGNVFPFGGAPSCGSLVGRPARAPDRRHGRPRDRRATGSSRPTAGSSPSATRVPRLDGRHAPEPADRRHGADAVRQGLLAGRVATAGSSRSVTRGSTARRAVIHLNQPIVGMAPTPIGQRLLAGRVRRRDLRVR